MQVEINWQDKVRFSASNPQGSTVSIDGPPEYGGEDAGLTAHGDHAGDAVGLRPMETMLVAAGSCSAFDVQQIILKQKATLRHLRVRTANGERAETIPKVFTSIKLLFSVGAEGISEQQVRRAIDLSLDKYCSAIVMLKSAGAQISYELEFAA